MKRKDVDQGLFIATESSIVTYGEICEAHTSICKGKLKLAKRTMEGHVVSIRLACTKEKSHSYLWSSSPYLPNDEYLVNHRIKHAFVSSGLLPDLLLQQALGVFQKKDDPNFSVNIRTMLKMNVLIPFTML